MRYGLPWFVWLVAALAAVAPALPAEEITHVADVVVAGGSTAALAAAVSAAEAGASVVLLEPTDWPGGQLTASAVPAIDEAWHQIRDGEGQVRLDVARVARMPANMSPLLRDALLATGNPGRGWVSRFCFLPQPFLEEHLRPLLNRRAPRLRVLLNTVVKQVETSGDRIVKLTAIQRQPRPSVPNAGYDRLPSVDLPDWYERRDSPRFIKRIHVVRGGPHAVFVDATEWGEVLALSGAPYLQGTETRQPGDGVERCGQSITYGFVQQLHETAGERDGGVPRPRVPHLGLGSYADRPDGWERVWTYRRLRASRQQISAGDLSLQNWGYDPARQEGGNDYPFGYLLVDRREGEKQRGDWQGGVNRDVLAAAEQRAYAWHHWFKEHAPERFRGRISLEPSALGTGHGLSKLPYVRDTRRSVGWDGFVLQIEDLAMETEGSKWPRTFPDRIAIGAYPCDVHPLLGCGLPSRAEEEYFTGPFTIPFRALTNRRFENLLVAGKTMAQGFLANAATRLHPTEWSTGIAAGVSAAYMVRETLAVHQVLTRIEHLQEDVRQQTPIDWTLPPQDSSAN